MGPMVTLMLVMSSSSSPAIRTYNYGVDAYYQGLSAEAISHYDKAIQLDPNYGNAYFLRRVAYINLGKDIEADAEFANACSLDSLFCDYPASR